MTQKNGNSVNPSDNDGLEAIRYRLIFHEGVFENDECGFEARTPFPRISVGDFIDPHSQIPAVEKQLHRVTAVKHHIYQIGNQVYHNVAVCVVPADVLF